jgi:hypothetical protein
MIGLPSLARRVSSMTRQPGIGLYRVLLCTGLFFFTKTTLFWDFFTKIKSFFFKKKIMALVGPLNSEAARADP